MIVRQIALGVAGLSVSLYAYYVKRQHDRNPNYKALCDLGPNASCTRVLTSRYDTGFGLASTLFGEHSIMNASNVKFGMGFYVFQLLAGRRSNFVRYRRIFLSYRLGALATPTMAKLAMASSIVACGGSIYLGCVLAFVLKDLCLVCVSTYIINAALLWSNYQTIYFGR